MSESKPTHAGPGRRNGQRAEKSPTRQYAPPAGYEIDHHDPDLFVLRCIEEGPINWVDDYAAAIELAERRSLAGKPTGVIPLADCQDSTLPEPGQRVRLSYESRKSGNTITVAGPVLGRSPAFGLVRIDDRRHSRVLIVQFDGDDPEHVRSRSPSGDLPLGPIRSFEPTPINGGIDE